ncbi:hypothetical protein [Nocardioides pelophilus]|uniref:hypothetical protein n=1 Tax=Nocardioides pelophilus TaxID=2172019 RepID=UPI0016036C0C|nr:hypothetical protein [Nocardioides pelophilus]
MRRFASLAVLGLLLALPLVATAHQAWSGPELHEARIGVAAPPIVAQALADSAATLEGMPFEVVPLIDADDAVAPYDAAEAAVGEGRLDAAVVIDLRATTDTLLVATTRTEPYVDALRDRLTVISKGYGRTLEVEYVDPVGASGSARTPGLLVAVWCAVAILVVAGISAERGAVAATPAHGVARLLAVSGVGAVCGVVSVIAVDPGGSGTALVIAATATVTVIGALVLAAESVLGLGGLAVASALMVGPALPLLTGVPPDLLVEPWHVLDRVSPQTAAWQVARDALDHTDGADGSWALIAAWAAIALLTLLTARGIRPGATGPRRAAAAPAPTP